MNCSGIFPGEVRVDDVFVMGEFALQPFPIIFVVAEVDEERDFIFLDHRDGVFDDGFEQFALCARSAHGDEEAARLFGVHAADAVGAVDFDVLDEFMVNVMTCEIERVGAAWA